MNRHDLERHQQLAARALQGRSYDLTAKYMAVCDLRSIIQSDPQAIVPKTVKTLGQLLQDSELTRHTRAYFLFKEAAGCLNQLATGMPHETLGWLARSALTHGLATSGPSQRAAAESLGSMPVSVQGPPIPKPPAPDIPRLPMGAVLGKIGRRPSGSPQWIGRSLVFGVNDDGLLLVFKTAPSHLEPIALIRETAWLDYFRSYSSSFPVRFDIPAPVSVCGSPVVLLEEVPLPAPRMPKPCSPVYAAPFLAHPDYFTYPNNSGNHRPLDDPDAVEAMFRNAFLLGHLSGMGIVHEAPIPLFHNRVQRHRREDHGRYQWHRAGRLDRWLESSTFPNVGLTGVRDFEHFVSFCGPSRELCVHVGTHLLSLLLVAGSYFRNKDKTRVGLDADGNPVDARDLFAPPLLQNLVEAIFHHYYLGFVGDPFHGTLPFDLETLVHRMIQEMGRDQHMEEVLRVADQERMSELEFNEFLKRHGFTESDALSAKRGIRDIVLQTGPHLGGFNQGISLPELIEAVGSMSALCILGRFGKENTHPVDSRVIPTPIVAEPSRAHTFPWAQPGGVLNG